jgi:hypothetical protein
MLMGGHRPISVQTGMKAKFAEDSTITTADRKLYQENGHPGVETGEATTRQGTDPHPS